MENLTRSKSIGAKASAAALVIGCLAILFWAIVRANAAWHFMHAKASAEPLFETGVADARLAAVETSLAAAMRFYRTNPDYLHFAGRVAVLRANQPGVVGAERKALLANAAASFRQALETRPLWPYSWAGLLSVKDAAGQLDGEFRVALQKSASLGPWEPAVQRTVMRSGLGRWERLAGHERQLVSKAVDDAMEVQPRAAFAVVREFGRPDLVCETESRHATVRRWCDMVLGEQDA
jgi:hypothetical protein